jgi:hypothetical protein
VSRLEPCCCWCCYRRFGIGDGGLHLIGVEAELERTLRNESENETENGHFRKSDDMVPFSKNDHF